MINTGASFDIINRPVFREWNKTSWGLANSTWLSMLLQLLFPQSVLLMQQWSTNNNVFCPHFMLLILIMDVYLLANKLGNVHSDVPFSNNLGVNQVNLNNKEIQAWNWQPSPGSGCLYCELFGEIFGISSLWIDVRGREK